MTDDTHHSTDAEDRSEDHQQAIEACQHALDALETGDLSHARLLLDEARAAVGRAEHDSASVPGYTSQEQREAAFDCYD